MEMRSIFCLTTVFSRRLRFSETITVSHEPSATPSLAKNGACCGDVELKSSAEASSLESFIGAVINIASATNGYTRLDQPQVASSCVLS